jgi:hypothetical protein
MKENELPPGKPFEGFSEDYYKGFNIGKLAGIEEGRKQITEELKRLLELNH